MRKRVPRRNRSANAAQRRQRQRVASYSRQAESLQRDAARYSAEGVATVMFLGSAFFMAIMGLPLLYALGGPMLATPFAYYMLKENKQPDQLVDEMTQPPGSSRPFTRRR